jgi:hypothetical protein
MAERDATFVFHTADEALAAAVVSALAVHQIASEARPVEAGGFEIRVADPDGWARQLADELTERLQSKRAAWAARAARTGLVEVVCEECGRASEFPASEMGTVQECPHCEEYIDIPDPSDQWGEAESGTPDEGEGGPDSENDRKLLDPDVE